MTLSGKNVGVALTGSYCTFDKVFLQIERLVQEKANVYTIFSDRSQITDTRFGKAEDFLNKAMSITGNDPITTIVDAEKLGPKNILDIIVIAPCTGNTLAKMANAITDSPVLMAAKGLLRNGKPIVIAIATNDALSNNLKNIGLLINTKSIYFVPFGQDNYMGKPYSMISHFNLIVPTLEEALEGRQLQPILMPPQ
ncbi:dipicolinate synthase subunit B [Lachnospiraceae bacterium MD1]|jgi:dipicolinate synthase subunit B|uniref:Dipicolinate synthase subunit B n=1 Tax=Variimorphobacter saccharofermentans TaxID=2755051 RepID=A0A839K3B0_9FIRM|nr:dipicolinate synthase subunit B [Variimorphobacter saccharofermentans]MBB2184106.1 dipicolinate synthase subunit B [Variimorphobacter saccharofermentans]